MKFFENIDQEEFLNNYWEKKHQFFPSVFKAPSLSMDRDEILSLAQSEDIESRVITQEDQDWDLEFGPVDSLNFSSSKKKWTLFIHNFNLIESFSNQLQKSSSFIPSWLFDDVLCSLSSDGASVGAHFDRYNVFIIQISGKRLWKIQNDPIKRFKKDCSIKVLEEFNADVEYELSPGDMIFIPPECGHEGTSIGESISLSLGFKSLESAQIMQFFASEVLETIDETTFFKTNQNDFNSKSYEISKEFVSGLHKKIVKNLSHSKTFSDSFLKFLTQPKSENYLDNPSLSLEEFVIELNSSRVQFVEEVRFLKCEQDFWINKIKFKLTDDEITKIVNMIEEGLPLNAAEMDNNIQKVLHQFFNYDLVGFIE